MNLLIMDRSQTVCRMLRNVLRQAGMEQAVETTNASQAIALSTEKNIQIIITGAELSDMSGLEFTRMLRNSGRHPDTQVILISSKGTPEDVLEAVNVGVNAYVVFPFDHAILVQKVRRAAERIQQLQAEKKAQASPAKKGFTRRQVI